MNLLWLACFLLSFSWSYALSIYEPADFSKWTFTVLLGLSAAFCDFYRRSKEPGRGGIKIGLKFERIRFFSSLKNALSYGMFVLLPQFALLPFFHTWASRNHSEKILAPIVSRVMNFFGVQSVSEGAVIYMNAPLKSYQFLSTWEKFGILYLFLFVIGVFVTLLLKKELKKFVIAVAVLVLYFIFRYVFIIMLYNTYFMHALYWERTISAVSFIPLCLWFMRERNHRSEMAGEQTICKPDFKMGIKWDKFGIVTAALFALLVVSSTYIFSNIDLGAKKAGRVVIDEYHSDWEWTTEVYDENWYGERSGYNYYCFYNYIDKFYDTKINEKPIDEELLRSCDVLILKTPTKPYSDSEVDAIVDFVANGGGLYLIGDHTNVFGTGTNLNKIAKHFDLRFNYDCTYELVGGNLSFYKRPRLFPHKVVEEMPDFLFATSCTLNAPWYAEDVIVGYGLKNLQADYSQKNFFPADQNSAHLEFGIFLQSAAVKYQRGRVLAFTDSTVFSNFWMFMRGKPELLLGSLQWLNKENRFADLNVKLLFAILSGVLLSVNILWWILNRDKISIFILVFSGLIAFFFSVLSVQVLNKVTFEPQMPIKDMVKIGFDRQYSDYELPDDLDGFKSNTDRLLSTFYVWTQRIEYFPKSHDNLLESLRSSDLSVLVRPNRVPENTEAILREVEKGARLLILDSAKYSSHSNTLLKKIGMRITEGRMHTLANYEEIENIPLSENASAITGGKSIIKDENGNTVFAVQPVGRGFVAVFSDPDIFYNHHLGDVSMNLTPVTEILSKLEFKMMKFLISVTPDAIAPEVITPESTTPKTIMPESTTSYSSSPTP